MLSDQTRRMTPLSKGRYTVRPAQGAQEMAEVTALRGLCFGAAAAQTDRFDTTAQQIVVRDDASGEIRASFRLQVLRTRSDPPELCRAIL